MKLADLSNKFRFKYAVETDEESPFQSNQNVTQFPALHPEPPTVEVGDQHHREMVQAVISHCVRNGVFGEPEADYLKSVLDRGEAPKHVLALIKGRLDNVQLKINSCKESVRALMKQVR